MKKQDLSPSLTTKRWQINIDKKISKNDLLHDCKIIQDYITEDNPSKEGFREFEKASKRLSENIDAMVIKFVYKPRPGNGSFVGYHFIDEILNEARLQCLTAIYDMKYNYKKSPQIFCYLTYTIHNACRQMMNRRSRQRNIKLKYIMKELIEGNVVIDHKLEHALYNNDYDIFIGCVVGGDFTYNV